MLEEHRLDVELFGAARSFAVGDEGPAGADGRRGGAHRGKGHVGREEEPRSRGKAVSRIESGVVEVGRCCGGGGSRLEVRRKKRHAQRREKVGRIEGLLAQIDERIEHGVVSQLLVMVVEA